MAQRPPAAAAVESAKQLELASEVQVQVYWQVNQRAVTNFEFDVLKGEARECKFETLLRYHDGHGQPGARPPHVPVICSRTGCKPDLESSCRRCCILYWRCSKTAMPSAGHRLGRSVSRRRRARRRTQQQFEMLDVRVEGLFLLCGCNDICYGFLTMVMLMIGINESSTQKISWAW